MPIVNGYATLAEVKARLSIETADTADDTSLEQVIAAASRMIDSETAREFYATTDTRYYTADDAGFLVTDDLITITTLATDETGDRTYTATWATTDYDLTPTNKPPHNIVTTPPNGRYGFPPYARGVKVVGSFGYCATGAHPAPIREACIIQAVRIFKRKDSPFGVFGTPELGMARLPRVDMDVAEMLHPYRRLVIVG